jgi:D-hexose-6-phosphate mutarotase
LKDSSRSIIYTIEKSVNITDYVVFNPGINGKRGAAAPDFDDDGYNYMFCVEPAIAVGAFKLEPLQTFSGRQTITSRRIEPPTQESLVYLQGDKLDFIK